MKKTLSYGIIENKIVDAYELFEIDIPAFDLPQHFLWQTREISCEGCRKTINVPYYPIISSCICNSCRMANELTSTGVSDRGKKTKVDNYIPIGTTFDIDNATYNTIGFLEKKDSYGYTWREFTLFSEKTGFAYLSEYNGNFSFLKRKKKTSVVDMQRTLTTERTFEHSQEYFQLFNNYNYTIRGGEGLFQGNVLNDGTPASIEYIAPPAIRSYEHVLNESIDVYDGRYISRKELQAATTTPLSLPLKQGVGATQPIVNDTSYKLLALFICLAVFVLTQIVFNLNKTAITVFEKNINITDSLFIKNGMVSETFDLNNSYNNLRVEMKADVLNTWIEPSVEIINIETGKSQVYEKGIEYYTGVSDGETWTEGSREEGFWIESLPKGKYQLAIKSQTNDTVITDLKMVVIANKWMARNLWLPILIIIALFSISYDISYNADRSRWSESPYNPYDNG